MHCEYNKVYDDFADLYNKKHNINLKFSGYIKAYKYDNGNYFVNIRLIVIENNSIIFDSTKEYIININNKYDIFMDKYEFINFYDKLDLLVSLTE